MNRFLLSMMVFVLALSISADAQGEWIGFGSRAEGTPPEVSINRSDNQRVEFSVTLPGMYAEAKSEASESYKRLSLPQCNTAGEVGAPEIPVITKMVAIPECDEVRYTITASGRQTFPNYNVYPVPAQEGCLDETFVKNAAAYAQNTAMPAGDYATLETGYLRSQRYLQLELHPVQYNPATGMLSVATSMEVSLEFVNATTPVNANLGIFNNVASKTILNYEDQGIKSSANDRSFEKDDFEPGDYYWRRIDRVSQVENITADYLIICSDTFFSGNRPNDEILRFAAHRSYYNNFDVMILNVEDIISDQVGFYYYWCPVKLF